MRTARYQFRRAVRSKITKPLHGSIDGLHLGRFVVGQVYDLGTSLANYLLAIRAAEPVMDQQTAPSEPMEHHELLDELRRRLHGDRSSAPAEAADHKRRPKKRR